jgi:hypothetical protein
MSARRLQASAAAVLLTIVACSTNSLPAASGDCVVVDGSFCTPKVIGGGSSGGGEGGAEGGSCSASAGTSQCGVCAGTSCCSELEQCSDNTACTNLLSCEDDCNGSPCVTACQQQFPTGTATLEILSSCLARDCPICEESGVGDPCGPQYYPCETGLTCNGLWCAKACVNSSNCAGIGPGGTNTLGFANACMATPHGNTCTPGCGGSASACADFPGTYCFTTTDDDGNVVSVCAALPDASTAD